MKYRGLLHKRMTIDHDGVKSRTKRKIARNSRIDNVLEELPYPSPIFVLYLFSPENLMKATAAPWIAKRLVLQRIQARRLHANASLKAARSAVRRATASKPRSGDTTDATDVACRTEALRNAEAREAALRAARWRRFDNLGDGVRCAAENQLRDEDYKRRYKKAARRWLSVIVALPIVIVTSYFLFDRHILGNPRKVFERPTPAPQKFVDAVAKHKK